MGTDIIYILYQRIRKAHLLSPRMATLDCVVIRKLVSKACTRNHLVVMECLQIMITMYNLLPHCWSHQKEMLNQTRYRVCYNVQSGRAYDTDFTFRFSVMHSRQDAVRSKSHYHALDESGVFGATCRHDIPLKTLSMKQGEKQA